MRVEELDWHEIKQSGPFFRNATIEDVPMRAANGMLGILQDVKEMLCRRDDGTMHRFQTYPIRPNAFKPVLSTANIGGLVQLQVTAHGYATNDIVYTDEIVGTTEGNGRWKITRIDADHFTLQGSAFVHNWISGGIVTKTPITLISMFPLFDENSGTEYTIVVGLDSANYTHVYVYDATFAAANPGSQSNWIELTRSFTALVNGTPVDPTATVTIDTVKDSMGNAYTVQSTDMRYMIAFNVDRGNAAYITGMPTTAQVTASTFVSSSGLGWVDNDRLIFYKDNGTFQQLFKAFTFVPGDYNLNLGANPYMRWNDITGQQKVNWYAGAAGAPPTMQLPVRFQRKSAARPMFYKGTGPLVTVPANWNTELGGGGLCPYYVASGSPAVPIVPTVGAWNDIVQTIEDVTGNKFMRITISHRATSGVGSPSTGVRIAFTLSYDDYQESDIIFEAFFQIPAAPLQYMEVNIKKVEVCFARMNKAITGLNAYQATGTLAAVTAGWPVNDGDYHLWLELPFDAAGFTYFGTPMTYQFGPPDVQWKQSTNLEYDFYLETDAATMNGTLTNSWFAPVGATLPLLPYSAAPTVRDNLGHAVIRELRPYLKPRFVVKAARSQGSLVVVNQDDRTLRLSTYTTIGGQLIHMDDAFPNLASDNLGNKQLITLIGKGPLQGLAPHSNYIWCFRNSEFELQDLASVNQQIAPCDFYAIESLRVHDGGMTWAGKSGLYWVPNGSMEIVTLNPEWIKEYVGSVLIDDSSASVITDAYRLAIISGWNPYTKEVFFQIQENIDTALGGGSAYVQHAYAFPAKQRSWRRRILNLISANGQQVRWFSQSLDGTFSILYADGILKYPNLTATRYEDDVASTGLSRSLGFQTDITLNVPEVRSQFARGVLVALVPAFQGVSVDKNGTLVIELYGNHQTIPFDTQYFKLDEAPDMRQVNDFGELDALKVRAYIQPANLNNIQKIDLSQIALGFKRMPRRGPQ